MRMTLNNSMDLLKDYLEWQIKHNMDPTGVDESIKTLLEVAKKYQYIQEIYKSWRTGDYKGSTECMEEIGEIIYNQKEVAR